MEEFALYLFRSALWITAFTFVWLLFLRNENYLLIKRIYLISGILASFFLPIITIRYAVEIPADGLAHVFETGTEVHEAAVPGPGNKMNPLFILYLAGAAMLALRLIWHSASLYRKAAASGSNTKYGTIILSPGNTAPFSFFGYMFLNPRIPEDSRREIINHEMAHIRQKHWIDLLLVELLCLLQWFNPAVWVYKGFIRQNHEYLADREALSKTADPSHYKATLLTQLLGSQVIPLTNPLMASLNKKRFEMMKKTTIHPLRKLRLLTLLPVMALIFWFCSEPVYNESEPIPAPVEITSSSTNLSQEDQPLIFVDGREIPYNEMGNINVHEIESVSVLKNASSIESYGERAVNGVILITLKKSNEGEYASEQVSRQPAPAGTVRINGRITGAGGPISGAGVMVTGTTTGTITDAAGNFIIYAEPGSSLTLFADGYKSQTRSLPADGIHESSPLNIRLEKE